MVKYKNRLDAVFGALADPTRRSILQSLARSPAYVTQLAAPHRMSLPAVMKHLRVLESAGLVTHRKSGRSRRCQLAAQPLKQAASWLHRYEMFWNRQFDSLEKFLQQEKSKEDLPWPKRKSRPKRRSS